ncbi:MAG: aminotransferase class V-fold PLP-dependent enzyme [Bryobacteraceae bacterium]|nr:aminotransferase class V-fold PLP-dependent enzyme [Bryobacteraceae bacterium]MDW8377586.1 aminotransferase class V-fold PLP-dependent enzyme [Bryobacterales bacterium]
MGFEVSSHRGSEISASTPLWRLYRDQFPVAQHYIYLNHAAVAPLSRRAAQAMADLCQDCLLHGSFHYDQWLSVYERFRKAAAQLIGASAQEIAIVKNTSEGISTIARGFPWKEGDKVVVFAEEFPANFFPWKRLETSGVRVEELSLNDSLERVDQACRQARLLAISYVNYLSGHRVDLRSLGEICRRHGVFFFVDAIQGLGAIPFSVDECHIDALSTDGHKWLLGPEGCGFLYVRQERLEEIEPAEFGWTNVANYADYGSREMTLRAGAGRYECGTLNTVGCFGLLAAMEFLLEIGLDPIAHAVLSLSDRLAEGLQSLGYELAALRTPATSSGIVSFRHPKQGDPGQARSLVAQLRRKGILAAHRQGWVRFSPHFYVSPEDIDRVLSELPPV